MVFAIFPSFLEGLSLRRQLEDPAACRYWQDFPSFWEGLSLRRVSERGPGAVVGISLPFRRDFQ